MKMNKKMNSSNNLSRSKTIIPTSSNEEKGFTIIETLFSLLLVALAVLLLTRAVVTAIDTYKKSRIRFIMSQEIESCKNKLLSTSFDSLQLQDGNYSKKENIFAFNWEIKSITPTIKAIKLSVSFSVSLKHRAKGFTRQVYFYRSKYIKNNKNNTTTEVKND